MDVVRHNINKFMHKNMLYKINYDPNANPLDATQH